MAFVGSLSGSVGTIAVTGSLVPGADNAYSIGTGVAKWTAVVASQLTGSLTKLADASDYLIAGTNVTLSTGSSGAVTINATSTATTPGGANTQIQYNADGVFAGKSTLTFASGTDTLSVTNISVTSLTASYVTSSGDFLIAGDVAVNGGDLTTTAATATLFNTNATTVNIAGDATSGTTVGNATGGVTLNGTATVTGDLAVNGTTSADITTTTATATLFGANATNVTLAGAATTLSLGSSSGTSTVNNNLVVKGDLYISGTTTTIDSTVVEIQDPVIGLGFASGSVAGTAGDRGFIGGITGAGNNVALVWSQTSGSFVVTKTTTAPGSSPVVLSTLLPMRAARFEVNGTAAYITSSDAQTLELNGASGKGAKFTIGAGTEFAQFVDNGANAQFGAVAGKSLILSGTNSITLNVGNGGTVIQRDGTAIGTLGGNSTNFNIGAATGVLTSSIVNSNVGLINFGGAATVINVGNSAGNVTFAGDIAVNGGDITTPASTFNLVNANATTVSLAGAATTLNIANGATLAQTLNLGTSSTGSSTYNLATGATDSGATKTINLATGGAAGSTTNVNIGSAQGGTTIVNKDFTVSGITSLNGDTTIGNATSDRVTFNAYVTSSILPSDDLAWTLGSQSQRWQHIYTGDLHLRNDRGDYTLIEEEDFLSIRFNKTGKRYKFLLEAVPELDEK
jgi:hypothetical protein